MPAPTSNHACRQRIYVPDADQAMVLWTTGFDYGDGRLGLSFNELHAGHCESFQAPRLEFGEAVGAPVSYCSAECGSENVIAQRVYMQSSDNGLTWQETGRCPLQEGSFCNVGFADNRIVGLNVGRINENGTAWCDYLCVSESTDGGKTWEHKQRLLEGCAIYLWRVRRLRDGSFLVLASFYGTPWGQGYERATRNTMLPDETYLSKIQTFFLHSTDGRSFSGPHYVLPGIGAHEYDAVELSDGRLLFIAGDVQATPTARQIVTRRGSAFINGPMLPIHAGAPEDPSRDPQGGYVPESIVCLPGDILVGSRRNKCYSCSSDLGANWYPIEGLSPSLYQPFMQLCADGTILNFGHHGGDCALGQQKTYIGADRFTLGGTVPAPCSLSLRRDLSEDQSHYENFFSAALSCRGCALPGQNVVFRFLPFWNEDGTVCTKPQDEAPIQLCAVTDENGIARVHAKQFDAIRDIYYSYNVDAVFSPADSVYCACRSAMMCVAAMTPHRRCRHPYDAYFAEGTLFLSPAFCEKFPNAIPMLKKMVGQGFPVVSDPDLRSALAQASVLICGDVDHWADSVHADGLVDVLPQGEGDWYI